MRNCMLMNLRPSSIVLIGANLVPVAGVLWLDWNVLGLLLLYWAESVVVGMVNVLRMASCDHKSALRELLPVTEMARTERIRYETLPGLPSGAIKIFLIPFFIVHYGMFCFAHLAAVIGLYSPHGLTLKFSDSLAADWQPGYWLAVVAIAVSHLYSYFYNFIGKGEYRRTDIMTLMHRPYSRIVAMHLCILLGGSFVVWLDSPLPMLLVLVVAKTAMDLKLHASEHRKLASHA